MSNKGNANQNSIAGSPIPKSIETRRVLDIEILTVVLTILSVIAGFFIFNADVFLVSKENGFEYILAAASDSLYDLVFLQYMSHGVSRVDFNIGGLILALILLIIGMVGILNLVFGNLENSRLLGIIAIVQIPIGVLMIIAVSISNKASRYILHDIDSIQGVESLLASYWIYFVCYLLLFVSSIMLAIFTGKREYKQ